MSFCQDCRTREVQNERLREIITNLTSELSTAKEDGARLDWILDYTSLHGTDGFAKIPWTIFPDDDGDISDRSDMALDRAAIDQARKEMQ